jgi:hypothetical protein
VATVPEPLPVFDTVSMNCGAGEKVAVTGTADVPIVKVHGAVPEQPPPLQPANTDAEDEGVAVSVTDVPVLIGVLVQAPGQAIPPTVLVTEPVPVPATVTSTANAFGMKLALTASAALSVTVQPPVPEHAPPHPANTELESAAGVSVTGVLSENSAVQVAPHVIPPGALETEPPPAPVRLTDKAYLAAGVKVAVTGTAAVPMGNVHVPVPEQPPPLQPANTDPGTDGVAVSVTDVPVLIRVLVQTPGQAIPPTLLVTEPVPVPATVTSTGNAFGMKLALTVAAAFIVTVQVPVPEQAPPQPANTELESAAGVSVTGVPSSKSKPHVAPQAIPAGELDTEPVPEPVRLTDKANFGAGVNVAVTGTADVPIVKVHGAVPEQPPPLQPANTDAEDEGVAVSVTDVPVLIGVLLQAPGQLIPPTLLVTAPLPVPATVTSTAYAFGMKLALTVAAAFIVTTQPSVPEHAPPHPANTELESAAAVSVTAVPSEKSAAQTPPHVIPPGALETEPPPAPVRLTDKAYLAAGVKVAVTGTAAVPIVNVHVPVPEQPPPLQPANTDPGTDGVAVSVTDVPVLIRVLVQTPGQLMAPVVLVTEPVPVPSSVTVTGNDAGMKSALADCAWLIVTVQTAPAVPLQAPVQPLNTEALDAGAAVKVTVVSLS